MYATAGNQQYSVTDIGALSSQFPYCAVTAINSCGQVGGQFQRQPLRREPWLLLCGQLWRRWSIWCARCRPDTKSVAYGLNNASVVVGVSNNQGFVWTPQNGMQGVGFLTGGTDSELESINDANVAVGAAIPAGAMVSHAAIWDPTNGLRDLNTLIVKHPGRRAGHYYPQRLLRFWPQRQDADEFGPINKSGGERRLNVAFSRAKHHMAVISSIQFSDITNDYNDGANCLKNYLRYAEAVSTGNREAAHRVLHGMSRWQATADDAAEVRRPAGRTDCRRPGRAGLHGRPRGGPVAFSLRPGRAPRGRSDVPPGGPLG